MGAAALAGGAWAAGAYRARMAATETRLALRSHMAETRAGPMEYALAGQGRPLMMIHGTGGGFDQGLLFGHRLSETFQVIAPSRFGYLRSAFPSDASPAAQANALADLLDNLHIDRLSVAGGSAGALTAGEFAVRHPDRCTHLVLLVPAANLTGHDPVEFGALQRAAVDAVLGSDVAFWALASLAPRQMIRTLLATDPALLDRVDTAERDRAETILAQLLPISARTAGLRNDAHWSGTPSPIAWEDIAAPTLILSCEDDLFGTAATARLLADRIAGARLTIWPEGGHIWLGHDADVAREIAAFDGAAHP
ncbi:MAG: alpha/beta hydrolase [Paracoccaceae bacterium]|jgi:pimeloyl-ACP methyl ester carboxylesterase|nr:alpha/beta hydrolase [Paracoccaceae bacterium]